MQVQMREIGEKRENIVIGLMRWCGRKSSRRSNSVAGSDEFYSLRSGESLHQQ